MSESSSDPDKRHVAPWAHPVRYDAAKGWIIDANGAYVCPCRAARSDEFNEEIAKALNAYTASHVVSNALPRIICPVKQSCPVYPCACGAKNASECAASTPSTTRRISPLRTCEHGVVYGDPCPACLEEAADMVTEQSAEHAQACRHAAVALSPTTARSGAAPCDGCSQARGCYAGTEPCQKAPKPSGETPRTDALVLDGADCAPGMAYVFAEDARQLERELAVSFKRFDDLQAHYSNELTKLEGASVASAIAPKSSEEIPLCCGCAQAWFTERNQLPGDQRCVVCAFLGNPDCDEMRTTDGGKE